MRKVLVVFLLLLIGGVIAADRLGVRKAEDEIAKQVASQYGLDTRPAVKIHGFPFLTQAIGGNYDQIDVTLGEWTEQGVTVQDAALKLSGVEAPLADVINGNSSQITVRDAAASATVPYSVVQKYAPEGVKEIGPSGSNLQAQVTGTVLGFRLAGDLVASIKATDRGLAVTPQSVSSNGARIPLAMLQRQYTFVIPTRNLLPMGAKISDVEVTPAGLRIAATVNDVSFENLSKS